MKKNSDVLSSEIVRRRNEHNEKVLEKCVAIMREHDQRAVMADFARCGCEFCKVVRYYEPPNSLSGDSSAETKTANDLDSTP